MRRRQLAAAAAAGIVLVGGGGVAYAQTQGSSGSYRTAAVTVGDVDETLALSGTIAASARQDLSFGADGAVANVTAAAGDTVAAGDVLAALDPTDLETAVTKARATWTKAKAQLESDQTSQASTVSSSAAATTTTPTTSGSSSSSKKSSTSTPSATPTAGAAPKSTTASPALTAALRTLADQQSAVTTAQTAATEAITAAKAALVAQPTACAVTTDDPVEEADPADGTAETPAAPAAVGLSEECTTALDAVQVAQDVVAQRQDTLQTALEALSSTLTAAVKTLGESSSTATGSTTPTTPAAPTESSDSSGSSTSSGAPSETPVAVMGSAGSGGSSGGGGTVTAATLAQDQAAIDTAEAGLNEAERALKAATLSAPFAGEILSVGAAKGDTVAASDVVIVIKGDGDTTVATTVTLDQIDEVEQGQTASVTPAGASEPVTGTVTAIGLLPDSSADTSTYPVTIDLDGGVAAPEGATASVQLVIGTAKNALTVPSSAVSTPGRTIVSVLTDGQPVITPVTVGVVGATRTSITEGLKDGQEVVLADLDAVLPSGDSATTRLPGAGGGFGGQGMPAGMTRPGGQGAGRG